MKITLTDAQVKAAILLFVNARLMRHSVTDVTIFVGKPEDGYESSVTAVLELLEGDE